MQDLFNEYYYDEAAAVAHEQSTQYFSGLARSSSLKMMVHGPYTISNAAGITGGAATTTVYVNK